MNAWLVILTLALLSTAEGMISRSEWGARQPKRTVTLQEPVGTVIIHHSATPGCTTTAACKSRVKNIQDHHMNREGMNDIAYHFLIGGDGNVYEGRNWGTQGEHASKHNVGTIGICVIGNFESTTPSRAILDSLKSLISSGVGGHHISSSYKLIGHGQTKSTACPGAKLQKEIETWPNWSSSL